MKTIFENKVREVLLNAGIEVGGNKPEDIQVHNQDFYKKVSLGGSLALGESYVERWWDCEKLDIFSEKILRAGLSEKANRNIFIDLLNYCASWQTKKQAKKDVSSHYDIDNDLYKAMLGKTMAYTCGYWKDASDLDEAQEKKFDLTCRKLNLQKGQRILDIGCGFGTFLKYAVEKYGVSGLGITLSENQISLGKKLCQGLPVEIIDLDYRDLLFRREKFDHIVSLGMFEHVGPTNYREYMEVVNYCLKQDGLFLLHTITGNKTEKTTDQWIEKYIFPGSLLPSMTQIAKAAEGIFLLENVHNFCMDYNKTLMSWYSNFAKNFDTLKPKYDEKFFRMWSYYLLLCAGSFRARHIQLIQTVFSKEGAKTGYSPAY